MNSDTSSSTRLVLRPGSTQDVITGMEVPSGSANMSDGGVVDYRAMAHANALNVPQLVHSSNQIVSDTTITSTQLASHQQQSQQQQQQQQQQLIQPNGSMSGVIVQSSPNNLVNLTSVKSKLSKHSNPMWYVPLSKRDDNDNVFIVFIVVRTMAPNESVSNGLNLFFLLLCVFLYFYLILFLSTPLFDIYYILFII